jgi:hypothetical protein
MEFKSPEMLIRALLKNELSVDDLQTALCCYGHRDRLGILERLEELTAKGNSASGEQTRKFF